ncbi:MAG: hypothetical protein PVI44_05910 [Balneolaceae bacterium]
MDHKGKSIVGKILPVGVLLVASLLFTPLNCLGQNYSYQLLPAPDIWYNSVDGIRIGTRVLGQVSGTFGDGPHRLNAGLWLGSKIPTHPVSYYLSYTEPITSISGFQSEANITLHSSYRVGFQDHGLTFNKRWQTGFDEQNYKELSLGLRAEHRFAKEYLLYDQLWQDKWLFMASLSFQMTDESNLGRYLFLYSADTNLGGSSPEFFRTEISFQQEIAVSESFRIKGKLYSGFASRRTAPEYLFLHSLKSARGWMDNGLTRARGTIPPSWMESGNIQVSGGANLRGYLYQDVQSLNDSVAPLFTSLSSANIEVDYPNPVDHALNNISVIGEFINLHSYLFVDAGTSLGLTRFEESRSLFDAGPGFLFSINIPDYLGKTRGLMIRYDMPLWLSDPGNEKSFKFRNVIGIGGVISL